MTAHRAALHSVHLFDALAHAHALRSEATIKYLVVIENGSSSFGAYVPDLPGCVAVGDTRDDATRLIELNSTAAVRLAENSNVSFIGTQKAGSSSRWCACPALRIRHSALRRARRFDGCGLACRARQSNVLGWWHST